MMIEILSFLGADRSVSAEGLRTYRAITRRYRNRRVGDFLKELRLTEGRNTGMAKILRTMRSNGSPDPVFETDEERLSFLVTLPIQPAFLAGGGAAAPAVSGVRNSAAPSPQDELLAYLRENPEATAAQAAYELGVSSATVSRRISLLKAAGRLTREGSARSGRWVVV